MSKRQHALQPPSKIETRIDQAYDLIERKKWRDAADILEPIVRKYPSNVDALELLGVAYDRLGMAEQTWGIAQKLVKFDPHTPETWYNAMVGTMRNGLPFSARHYAQHYLAR